MAEQFETLEGAMDALEGPHGSTIVSERNKVALKRLAEQIAAGKKKIAIFYGAGHMNDLEKRLVADFHLRRGTTDWLTAWKLEKAAPAKLPVPKQSRQHRASGFASALAPVPPGPIFRTLGSFDLRASSHPFGLLYTSRLILHTGEPNKSEGTSQALERLGGTSAGARNGGPVH